MGTGFSGSGNINRAGYEDAMRELKSVREYSAKFHFVHTKPPFIPAPKGTGFSGGGDIKKIRVENIKHLRTGRKRSRYLDSFVYREIFGSLQNAAERQGVLVEKVDPAYTSQRCSCCGWTRKRNRKGRKFDCGACGFIADADFNASTNISLDLRPIGIEERRRRPNLSGFYWKEVPSDRSL